MRTILHQNYRLLLPTIACQGVLIISFFFFNYSTLTAAHNHFRLQIHPNTLTDSVRNYIQRSNDTLQGNPQRALDYALTAAKLLPEKEDEILQAELNYALGASYTEVGNYSKAITTLRKSAKLFLSHQQQQKYADAMN